MDCPTEVQLVKLALSKNPEISSLEFDLPNRKLAIFHNSKSEIIDQQLEPLNLGYRLLTDEASGQPDSKLKSESTERRLLWIALAINSSFFLAELFFGLYSDSMGLIADSLDMLADAIVYGISLLAVGSALSRKMDIARISGYFQIALAFIGIFEIFRRVVFETEVPNYQTIVLISFLALLGNTITLWVLSRSKSDGVHMKASMIFTSNDIKINIGVILSGILVFIFKSKVPDLIVGTIIFGIVSKGAFDIIKMTMKK